MVWVSVLETGSLEDRSKTIDDSTPHEFALIREPEEASSRGAADFGRSQRIGMNAALASRRFACGDAATCSA